MRGFILALISITFSVTSVWGNTCSRLFDTNNLLANIELVNTQNNGYLSNDAPVEYQILVLKNRQKNKVNKLLKKIEEEGFTSDKDILETAEELTILLYGKRDTISNYFFKSKDQKANDSVRLQVKKQLLEKGLRSFLNSKDTAFKTNAWIKTKKIVHKLILSQFWNWYQIPFGLPSIKDKPISEELLNKIVWNGVSENKKEISEYYKVQGKKETYAIIRQAYSAIALVVITSLAYHTADVRAKTEHRAQVEMAAAQLDVISETLPAQMIKFNEAVKATKLNEAIEEAQKELNRELTPEEIQELKNIIYNV
jgi:hypothetical protein